MHNKLGKIWLSRHVSRTNEAARQTERVQQLQEEVFNLMRRYQYGVQEFVEIEEGIKQLNGNINTARRKHENEGNKNAAYKKDIITLKLYIKDIMKQNIGLKSKIGQFTTKLRAAIARYEREAKNLENHSTCKTTIRQEIEDMRKQANMLQDILGQETFQIKTLQKSLKKSSKSFKIALKKTNGRLGPSNATPKQGDDMWYELRKRAKQ